jgi:internalin A
MSDLGEGRRTSRRWYHWLLPRFSLRTLLIAVTVFALVGGYWIERAERQRRAAEFLTKHGIQWQFSTGAQGGAPSPLGVIQTVSPPQSKHFDHYFQSITSVPQFFGLALSRDEEQEVISNIARLPALEKLSYGTATSGIDWKPLKQAQALTELTLFPREISTPDMEALGALTQLKQLHLNGFAPERIDLSALARLKNLRELELRVFHGDEIELAPLATLPKVETLRLANLGVDDSFCEELAKSKTLKVLSLSKGEVTDRGADSLSRIASLETLDLSNTFVTDAAIDSLIKLPKLTTVGLGDTRVTFQGLARLCEKGTVKHVFTEQEFRADGSVSMQGISFGARGPVRFDGIPAELLLGKPIPSGKLEALDLDYAQFPAEFYERISKLTSLTHLDLSYSNVSDDDLARLANLRQLENLSLTETVVTAKGVEHFAGLQNLHSFMLPEIDDWESLSKTLRSFPKLQYLNASFGHIESRDLAAAIGNPIPAAETSIDLTCIPPHAALTSSLAAATHLRKLKLADAPWTDKDIAFLSNYKKLTELSLAQTEVTDQSLPILESLTSLLSLDLSATSLTEEAIVSLAKLPNLRTLIVEETSITDATVELLTQIDHLDELHLRGANITDRSIESLRKMPSLSVLSIGRKRRWPPDHDFSRRGAISDEAFALLVECPRLTKVDIYQSELTPGRVAAFRAMPHLNFLTIEGGIVAEASFLELFGRRPTPIASGGFAPTSGTAYVLNIPPHLRFGSSSAPPLDDPRHVSLEKTDNTDHQLRELAARNVTKTLELYATDVTAVGMEELAKLSRLEMLTITDADLGDEIVPALCKLPRLRELSLYQCKMSPSGVETLAQLPMLRQLSVGKSVLAPDEHKLLRQKYPQVYRSRLIFRRR